MADGMNLDARSAPVGPKYWDVFGQFCAWIHLYLEGHGFYTWTYLFRERTGVRSAMTGSDTLSLTITRPQKKAPDINIRGF